MLSLAATKLKERLANGEYLQFMGVGDVMTAKIIESVGFDGVAVQSFQTCAQEGLPDDTMTASDYMYLCFRMAQEIEIPILLDMFDGFGSPAQAAFWFKRFENAGVACVHIDDLGGDYKGSSEMAKTKAPVVEAEYMAEKISRMKEIRKGDIQIIARTVVDLYGQSLDQAIERLKLYTEAGADILWVPMSALSDDAVKYVRDKLELPLVMQGVPSTYDYPIIQRFGKWYATLTFEKLQSLGVQIYNFTQLNVIGFNAIRNALLDIKKAGSLEVVGDRMMSYAIFQELAGYHKYGMGD